MDDIIEAIQKHSTHYAFLNGAFGQYEESAWLDKVSCFCNFIHDVIRIIISI